MSLAEDLNPRAVIGDNRPPLADLLAVQYADLLADVGPLGDRAASLPKKIDSDILLGRLGDVVKDAGKLIKRLDTARSSEVDPHLTAQREINGFFKGVTEGIDAIKRRLEGVATDYQRAKAAEERRAREEAARKLREEEDRQRAIAEAAAAQNQPGKALKHDDRAEEAAENARRAELSARASAADLTRVRSGSGTVATTRTAWKGEVVEAAKIDLEKLRPYLPLEALQKALNSAVRMGVRDCAGTRIFQDDKASFR